MLKDLAQEQAGHPCTYGSRGLTRNIASQDSEFVRRARDAGLVFLGRTATPEFGLKAVTESELWGPSRNPWQTECTPGGSSGGSGAAVAAGVVPMAGANDGGGSIRIPAAYNGLFGLKPTHNGHAQDGQHRGESVCHVAQVAILESVTVEGVPQPSPEQGRQEEQEGPEVLHVWVIRKTMGDLGDGHDEDEVVEQIEEAHAALANVLLTRP